MSILVDIQGFRGINNKFVLKEIAVLDNGNRLQHFTIKSPYKINKLSPNLQYEAKWLKRYHHGLEWNMGATCIEAMKQQLKPILQNSRVVYVKGHEKGAWLKQLFEMSLIVEDLSTLGCPNLQTLKSLQYKNNKIFRCLIHSGSCSLENIILLKKFLDCIYLEKNK